MTLHRWCEPQMANDPWPEEPKAGMPWDWHEIIQVRIGFQCVWWSVHPILKFALEKIPLQYIYSSP